MSLLSLIRICPPETSGRISPAAPSALDGAASIGHPRSRRQAATRPMKIRSSGTSATLMLAIAVLLQPALGKDIPVPAPKPKPAGVQAKPKPKPAQIQAKPKPAPAEEP